MSNCDSKQGEVPVVGDDRYCVDRTGRVRSFVKTPPRVLHINRSDRYPRVKIGSRTRKLHRVVAEAHHGPQPCPTCEVHHKDFNPQNAHADNLEWLPEEEHWEVHSQRRGLRSRATKAGDGTTKEGGPLT